jgi:hypothetical protein
MMIRDAARVVEALAATPDAPRVSRGWPKMVETLPCLVVSEAGNVHARYYANQPYLDEITMDVRAFAVSPSEIDALAPMVDGCMESLGYTRVLSYDDDSADVRMLLMRYTQLFG